jgi:hypoxanthine phosphoribosyltransferase
MSGAGSDPATVEVVFSADAIADRIDALTREIAGAGLERPLVISVLTGSFIFAADLLRGLHRAGLELEVDFLSLSSYQTGTAPTGRIGVLRDVELEVAGRDILLVDDILDTGRTLAFAKDLIAARGARQIKTCVLLDKRVRRMVEIEADFIAFNCPPVFVVGYGMDLAHRYRELPFVGKVVTA